MKESFAQLFETSIKKIKFSSGEIIKGTVLKIDKNIVLIDTGLKSESIIPIEQFKNSQGELEVKIGDITDVVIDTIEDGYGETILSREKAKKIITWIMLEKAYLSQTNVIGKINERVKGGFSVEVEGIKAFLPGSLIYTKPTQESYNIEGQILEFKVVKLDAKRNNIVISRKAVLESANNVERNKFLKNIKEGMAIKGTVKNITDYGSFIDIGGFLDGLLHITDISWTRIKHPSEILKIGDEITVKILKFDQEKTRVSLGLKQLFPDPWEYMDKNNLSEGKKTKGRITNLTDYGCFVEISPGIEGLVHISEMDWVNKNIQPSKIVHIDDIIDVMILNIDKERRRISLGIKQCKPNPWIEFAKKNNVGDQIIGKIKSVTEFGIFIELPGGIDGLVHLSNISCNDSEEELINKYKKGSNIKTSILQIDIEKERISLGIKQLEKNNKLIE